jgi:hypothetical protein
LKICLTLGEVYSLLENNDYCSGNLFRYDTLISTRTYQTLVRNFAAELELLGLWQWSVFVLLHLPGYVPVYETDEANEAVMAASDEVDQYVTRANGLMSRRS